MADLSDLAVMNVGCVANTVRKGREVNASLTAPRQHKAFAQGFSNERLTRRFGSFREGAVLMTPHLDVRAHARKSHMYSRFFHITSIVKRKLQSITDDDVCPFEGSRRLRLAIAFSRVSKVYRQRARF